MPLIASLLHYFGVRPPRPGGAVATAFPSPDMPGRRRVRLLAIAICIVTVFILYERNAVGVDEYADYFTHQAVGGGSVLRKPDQPAVPGNVPAPEPATAPQPAPQPAPFVEESSSSIYSSSSSTSSFSNPVATPPPASNNQNGADAGNFPEEFGEGRVEMTPADTATTTVVHWEKLPEQFPVTSTIQLPTGKPSPIPLIQHAGKRLPDRERLEAIKNATRHSWNGYKKVAFGYDEVRPDSGTPKDSFNGWGATLVDSLDTLWIMGMKDEFEEAVEKVKSIDFTTSPRNDIPLFEVTIRYMGGLIGGYDVSGRKYQILLDKAVELGELLYSAFDTPNRMPQTNYNWKPTFSTQPHRAESRVVLAEIGTLAMEFTRLAQISGEPKYYDAVARITDALEVWQNNTRAPGMWPTYLDASGCSKYTDVAQKWSSTSTKPSSENSNNYVTMTRGKPVQYEPVDEADGDADLDVLDNVNTKRSPILERLTADDEFASSLRHTRRQLELLEDTDLPLDTPRSHKKRPTMNDVDVRTGEDLCVPQGLNSSSREGRETFTLGGMSDSVYEYFPKQYLLLGGRTEQYKTMYMASIKTVIEKLLYRPMNPDELDILASGDLHVRINGTDGSLIESQVSKIEHLTCFVGGMFAMGGKIFELPEHVEMGRKLTNGCVWAYNSTASGIMPEGAILASCEANEKCPWNQTAYWSLVDPFAEERLLDPDSYAKKVYLDELEPENSANVVGPPPAPRVPAAATAPEPQFSHIANSAPAPRIREEDMVVNLSKRQEAAADDPPPSPTQPDQPPTPKYHNHKPVYTEDYSGREYFYQPISTQEYVKERVKDYHIPPGFISFESKRYLLRPEALESVFYMYRITGEQYWRDMGWKMFESIRDATEAEFGHSGIDDVTEGHPYHIDGMESFWIAETLKYLYLLFDDPSNWSLDEWVLNTEAHFFQRPKNPTRRA